MKKPKHKYRDLGFPHLEYQQVKAYELHCSQCDQEVARHGSDHPFDLFCDCGIWEFDLGAKTNYEQWKLKPKQKIINVEDLKLV